MACGELGRIALEVADLDAVATDVQAIFELVERVVAEPLPAQCWRPPLAALNERHEQWFVEGALGSDRGGLRVPVSEWAS